jgi:hypothetical protein
LIGAPYDNDNNGAAYVFTRSGSTWSQLGTKLTGSGATGAATFGTAVALSSEAATALIGGPNDNPNQDESAFVGAAWVFAASTPSAPTNVTAVPGAGQATVSFTGSFGASSYTVTSSPGGFQATGSSSPIVVSGLTNGQPYTFAVTASNAAGTSGASAPSSSVMPYTVPGAPVNVSAAPGDGSARVNFTQPPSNGGNPIQYYTVTASPGGQAANGTGSPITVSGLTNGVMYTFTVTATNTAGAGTPSAATNAVIPDGASRPGTSPPAVSAPRVAPPDPPQAGPRVPPP